MGGSESVLGWFSASVVPGIMLGAPLAGRLASRVAERTLIAAGLTVVAATSLAFAATAEIGGWLVPLRFAHGIGHGIVFAGLFGLAAHHVPDRHKSQGIAHVALTAQLGNVAGVALAEWLALRARFPLAFTGAAALAMIGTICAWRLLPDSLSEQSHAARAAEGDHLLTPTRAQVVLCIAFFCVLGGSYGTVLQMLPLIVHRVAAQSGEPGIASPVLATIFLAVAVCRLLFARHADGRHRRPLLISVMAVMVAATLMWPYAQSIRQLMIVAVFFPIGYGLLFPGINALVLGSLGSRWRSRASGWMVMAYDGGFFGLLLILGPIAERCGYAFMFALLATLQLAGGMLFYRMARQINPRSAA